MLVFEVQIITSDFWTEIRTEQLVPFEDPVVSW